MKRTETQSSWNARHAVANLRASIGRQFAQVCEMNPRFFRLALNEAEALAWETGFPHLVFPTLAVEKVQAVCRWHKRQTSIQRADTTLAFAA